MVSERNVLSRSWNGSEDSTKGFSDTPCFISSERSASPRPATPDKFPIPGCDVPNSSSWEMNSHLLWASSPSKEERPFLPLRRDLFGILTSLYRRDISDTIPTVLPAGESALRMLICSNPSAVNCVYGYLIISTGSGVCFPVSFRRLRPLKLVKVRLDHPIVDLAVSVGLAPDILLCLLKGGDHILRPAVQPAERLPDLPVERRERLPFLQPLAVRRIRDDESVLPGVAQL